MRRLATAVRDWVGRGRGSSPSSVRPEFPDLEPRQLTMAITGAAARLLELPAVPAGYALRAYQAGDETAWMELLAIEFPHWDNQQFDDYLAAPDRRQGSRVIERDGRIVAATFATRVSSQPLTGTVDYVVCHPDHRGRKLGLIACGAVTGCLGEKGYQSISLQTDDWRLPAIKVYLDLGYRPVMNRIDMPVRWETVTQRLSQPGG